jgi:hypothetical protein
MAFEALCSVWPSFWATRTSLTDQQSEPDCNEGGADGDEGAALPGASNCQKDDADDEEHSSWSSRFCRRAVSSFHHAPNV